jgi:hypothetical protein
LKSIAARGLPVFKASSIAFVYQGGCSGGEFGNLTILDTAALLSLALSGLTVNEEETKPLTGAVRMYPMNRNQKDKDQDTEALPTSPPKNEPGIDTGPKPTRYQIIAHQLQTYRRILRPDEQDQLGRKLGGEDLEPAPELPKGFYENTEIPHHLTPRPDARKEDQEPSTGGKGEDVPSSLPTPEAPSQSSLDYRSYKYQSYRTKKRPYRQITSDSKKMVVWQHSSRWRQGY